MSWKHTVKKAKQRVLHPNPMCHQPILGLLLLRQFLELAFEVLLEPLEVFNSAVKEN